jgi:phage terminase large subunit-like protein
MPANDLHASSLAALTATEQEAILDSLSDEECLALLYDWSFIARPKQLMPALGDWDTWFLITGRGWGKTRSGAEGVRKLVDNGYRRIALVARTAADARDVMVEGESGLLNIFPPHQKPVYEPSKRRITFHNGAIATTYSADKPDQLRGPQHDAAWCDEVASWRYSETWDNLQFGLRLGTHPIVIGTTTPRPTKFMRDLLAEDGVIVTEGHTMENAANLAKRALKKLLSKYEGTRLGKQELAGKLLTDTPGALWTLDLLDTTRVSRAPNVFEKVVVGVDPAVTSSSESDETGIIVVGRAIDGHVYVIEDASVNDSPEKWALAAISAYERHDADSIVAEVNNGGDLVESIIRTAAAGRPSVPAVRTVRATRGKYTRAEPVSMLYEQHRAHHVGAFAELEDQQATWVQGDPNSPDRLDALVWAVTSLSQQGVASHSFMD